MVQTMRLHRAKTAHSVGQLVELSAGQCSHAPLRLQLAVQTLEQQEGLVQGVRKLGLCSVAKW
jgi:hypothetical protein